MPSQSDRETSSSVLFETPTTRFGKFIVFIILLPPTLFCNLLLVYHLTADRTLRRAIHHHVTLALLIVSLLTNAIEVPRILAFLHQGFVIPATVINCLIWQWCDFTLCSLTNLLMCWMSIERHLLIFHSNIFNVQRNRILLHYVPIFSQVIYIGGFYAVTMFLYPCQPQPNYSSVLCGLPCFSLEAAISTFDLIAHNLAPLIFNIILSCVMIFRVLYRKRVYMNQRIQWRKFRKMIIELLVLSFIHSVTVAPYAVIPFIGLFAGLPTVAYYIQTVYFYYLFWLMTLLLPLVCIFSISEIRQKITKDLKKIMGHKNRVNPFTQNRFNDRAGVGMLNAQTIQGT